MTQAQEPAADPRDSKRPRPAQPGIASPNSDLTLQPHGPCMPAPRTASGAAGTAVSGPPSSSTKDSTAELQRQLEAVEMMYRVYKVEHYAVLEEMRLSHTRFRGQGNGASRPQQQPGAGPMDVDGASQQQQQQQQQQQGTGPPLARMSVHSMVAAKRSGGISGGGAPQPAPPVAGPSAPAPVVVASAPAAAPPPSATPTPTRPITTSSLPSSPPVQQQRSAATQQPEVSGSPAAGLSLNAWMPATAPTANNTPQSVRNAAPQQQPVGSDSAAAAATATAAASAPGAALGASAAGRQGHLPAIPEGASPEPAAGAAGAGSSEVGPAGTSTSSPRPHVLGTSEDGLAGSAAAAVPSARLAPGAAGYGDDALGYGSDADPATFTDVEDEVLAAGPTLPPPEAAGVDEGRVEAWRQRFAAHADEILALEALASSTTQAELDVESAIACLCGRAGRYLIRRTTVLLGRGSDAKGTVDVDLAKEARVAGGGNGGAGGAAAGAATASEAEADAAGGAGPGAAGKAGAAAKVSRRQAFLTLRPDGGFWVENVGRRPLRVDGADVGPGAGAPLRHLGLLEAAGGVRLLLMVNHAAVERVLRRTARMVA